MKTKHNGEIALWKFVYCLMIIALHFFVTISYHGDLDFNGGSIGVEFFFIVSGYLLGKKALSGKKEGNIGNATYAYMKNRVLKMMPMVYLILFFSLIFYLNVRHYQNYQIANFVWDFLFLRNSGLKYSTLMYVGWYISVLLFSSLLLYPVILNYKKTFTSIIGPIIILLCGCYIAHEWGNLAWDGEYYIKCFLRGFFEMTIGVCLFEYANKIRKIKWTVFSRTIMTLIEYVGFIGVLFLVNTRDFHIKYDFVALLVLSISILIAFSGQSIVHRFLNNRFVFFLEKLSFPMFLAQGLVIDFYLAIFSFDIENVFVRLAIVIVLDVVLSIFCLWSVKKYEKVKDRFIKLFILEDNNHE